jgi:TRAP-type C4-dicarboxylate transport system permease small subunit
MVVSGGTNVRILSRAIELSVIAMASVIVSVVTVEVILRYILGLSLIITEELSRYLMVWVVFLASVLAFRDDSHIRITFFTRLVGPKGRFAMELGARVLSLAFLVVLTVQGIRVLPRQWDQHTITLDIPIFWFYLAIPCGSILMFLFVVAKIKRLIEAGPDSLAQEEPKAP